MHEAIVELEQSFNDKEKQVYQKYRKIKKREKEIKFHSCSLLQDIVRGVES